MSIQTVGVTLHRAGDPGEFCGEVEYYDADDGRPPGLVRLLNLDGTSFWVEPSTVTGISISRFGVHVQQARSGGFGFGGVSGTPDEVAAALGFTDSDERVAKVAK